MKKFDYHGMEIVLESVEQGYGYIRGTKGEDGSALDCFWGGNKKTLFAFIFRKRFKGTEKFDETKIMLGFETVNDCMDAWKKRYKHTPLHDHRFVSIPDLKKEIKRKWSKNTKS